MDEYKQICIDDQIEYRSSIITIEILLSLIFFFVFVHCRYEGNTPRLSLLYAISSLPFLLFFTWIFLSLALEFRL